ncbi:MAG: ribosomal protein L7/L12 [Candidatus Limnocylindria bacterium]
MRHHTSNRRPGGLVGCAAESTPDPDQGPTESPEDLGPEPDLEPGETPAAEEDVEKEEADKLNADLEEAGASVEVK